jgi:hypothetical protein
MSTQTFGMGTATASAPSNSFICPAPLVYFNTNQTSHDGYEAHVVGYNCAVPCPTVIYSDQQWDFLADTVLYTSGIACVLSLAVFLAHVREFKRYYIRIMFISGFVVNSFIMFTFQLMNRGDAVVCHGEAEYVPRASMCMIQSVSSIWMLIWAHTWSVIMSYDTYLHVMLVYKHDQKERLQYIYTLVGFLIPTILTIFPVAFQTVGFDYQANLPICLYLVSSFNWVFWFSFVVPFYVLLTISLVFTLAISRRIHQVFISSGHYQLDLALNPKLKDVVTSKPTTGQPIGKAAGSKFAQSYCRENVMSSPSDISAVDYGYYAHKSTTTSTADSIGYTSYSGRHNIPSEAFTVLSNNDEGIPDNSLTVESTLSGKYDTSLTIIDLILLYSCRQKLTIQCVTLDSLPAGCMGEIQMIGR